MGRSPKHPALLAEVQAAIRSGQYVLTSHARLRLAQRKISLLEVLQVIDHGYHEKSKDEYIEAASSWNYSIRGRTVDHRNLRIAVAFDPILMLITVIDLDA